MSDTMIDKAHSVAFLLAVDETQQLFRSIGNCNTFLLVDFESSSMTLMYPSITYRGATINDFIISINLLFIFFL